MDTKSLVARTAHCQLSSVWAPTHGLPLPQITGRLFGEARRFVGSLAAAGGGVPISFHPAEKTMLHYSCDICKRPIDTHVDVHHVVKIEVFPAVEELAQQDGCDGRGELEDAGHLEVMQDMLEHLDDEDLPASLTEGVRLMRFDLCDVCQQRFVKNPLGLRPGKQFDFSNN